ncbi:hypothetical protein T01_1264 [Trichinella spiralis]|uniref:Uncharacterized protein n=1 Tax=Trichinella spiralis TaxID=6334 RepID=A0A0V1BBN9_TRISP|nr:hypothetical protein T01_1264 [Trichinella spiralis]
MFSYCAHPMLENSCTSPLGKHRARYGPLIFSTIFHPYLNHLWLFISEFSKKSTNHFFTFEKLLESRATAELNQSRFSKTESCDK